VCGDRASLPPKGEGGRPTIGLDLMVRMLFVQHWFNLADEAREEALSDSASLRSFVGIDLRRERVPDATTLLKFRRPAGDPQAGREAIRQGGRGSARPRPEGGHRDYRGRHHHRCAQFDEERRQEA